MIRGVGSRSTKGWHEIGRRLGIHSEYRYVHERTRHGRNCAISSNEQLTESCLLMLKMNFAWWVLMFSS